MVIIATPSVKPGGLNGLLQFEFGRCECFTFVTVEKNEITKVKVIENTAAEEPYGAGREAVHIINSYGAEKLIVSELGANATSLINSFNIKVFRGPEEEMNIKDILFLYLQGNLDEISPEALSKGVLNIKKKKIKN
jgi:predicted Fe-Mo cluster-binding NifX family protein